MRALVTGATAGFGQAIARKLIADGATVFGTGRRRDRLDALAAELPAFTGRAVDMRDTAALQQLAQQMGDIDLLVNNAGLALGLGSAQDASLDDWQTMIATNCTGLVTLTHAVLPQMVERGRGDIVNIGSIAGDYPYPGGNVYGATKAFVKQFSLNLRADLAGTGVRVTNIEPGLAETEFSLVRFKGDADKAQAPYAGAAPLVADDIADIVSWVLQTPRHVNINRIEVMPASQGPGPLQVVRT